MGSRENLEEGRQGAVLEWVNGLLPTLEDEWRLASSEKYPYSEIYIFQQETATRGPEKIVIKCYRDDQDGSEKTAHENMKRESRTLDYLYRFNDKYGINTPKLYGINENLGCLATSHGEGDRFVNPLLQQPLIPLIGKYDINEYKQKINRLGNWLKEVHLSKGLDNGQEKVEKLINRDLEGIRMRVDFLAKNKKGGLDKGLGGKITAKAEDLAKKIIEINPGLKIVHGDFTVVNMLYNQQSLTVLDFATFGPGLPEDDLARISLDFVNIDNYSFLLRPSFKGSLSRSFFSGYGKDLDWRGNPAARFFLIKHAMINLYMYVLKGGTEGFLNPILCRILFFIQKKFLREIIR